MKLTRDEYIRAEGAINALDVAGPRILELQSEVQRLRENVRMLRETLINILRCDWSERIDTVKRLAAVALTQTEPRP